MKPMYGLPNQVIPVNKREGKKKSENMTKVVPFHNRSTWAMRTALYPSRTGSEQAENFTFEGFSQGLYS